MRPCCSGNHSISKRIAARPSLIKYFYFFSAVIIFVVAVAAVAYARFFF
jgi:hypothetical protein